MLSVIQTLTFQVTAGECSSGNIGRCSAASSAGGVLVTLYSEAVRLTGKRIEPAVFAPWSQGRVLTDLPSAAGSRSEPSACRRCR